MQFEKIMEKLESLGTYQNRKVYEKHGVTSEMFGLSFNDINRLSKRIKKNTHIALKLWDTDNHDARVLATKVMTPSDLDPEMINRWVAEIDNYILADAFAGLLSGTCYCFEFMQQWLQSESEWQASIAWTVLAKMAIQPGNFDNGFYAAYLEDIRQNIHTRKNRVRYSMNSALIAIGSRDYELRELALGVAKEIGEVVVDHGDTNCKTPDAADYIAKTWSRRERGKL